MYAYCLLYSGWVLSTTIVIIIKKNNNSMSYVVNIYGYLKLYSSGYPFFPSHVLTFVFLLTVLIELKKKTRSR